MSFLSIAVKIPLGEEGEYTIVSPQTEDVLIEEDILVLYRFSNPDPNLPLIPFAEQEAIDSAEWSAIKSWWGEHSSPHILMGCYLFGSGISEDIPIAMIPLPNRIHPFPKSLLTPRRLQKGHGIKVKLMDVGYGLNEQNERSFISVFGDAIVGRDEMNAPITHIDATTSVTNTADGKTIKEGILPTNNWELSGQELSPAYNWNHGDLLPIIDGNPDTYWESSANLADSKIIINIHLGKEYQINGMRMKNGDIPNMAKGVILTSTDAQEYRSVGHSGFLDGDINFAKRTCRWIRIETSANINVGYNKWKLYNFVVYGDITQDSETATNPIISPFSWFIEHIRFGNTGTFNSNLLTAPVIERLPANNNAKINSSGGEQPQLIYNPFQSAFTSEPTGLSSELRMTQEIVGIEIDLGRNFDVELIDAQFETTPKQWRGFLMGSKDYQTWLVLASGFISELKSQAINFTQCRFLRLMNDASGNHANGLSTPPRMNKFNIHASLSMQQIEPYTPPPPAGIESLNSIVWLKDGELTNHGSAGGTFSNNNVPTGTTLNNISVFNFSNGYLSLTSVDFQSPEKLSAIALLQLSSTAVYHGVIDFPMLFTYEITPDPNRKASILRRSDSNRTAISPEVADNPIDEWILIGWEIDFITEQVKFYSGSEFSPFINLAIPSPSVIDCIIGYYHPNQGGDMKGDLAELAIFHGGLPTDMTEIKADLNTKWGLSL